MKFIEYYPKSPLPAPIGPIVDQRAQKIAEIYEPIVDKKLQLASRLITPEEILPGFEDTDVYGVVGEKLSDGDKSMLYRPEFSAHQLGKVVRSRHAAIEYAEELFDQGDFLRAKDPTGTNGQGQYNVKDLKFLGEVMDQTLPARGELLLMPYVNIERQISVGRFKVGDQRFHYVGEEFSKPDGQFGGGSLAIMRHGIDEERRRAAAERLHIQPRVLALGDWALDTYANLDSIRYVGRNSVDVIEGTTTSGRKIVAVTDVSPRVSGHTLTEATGARVLSADPSINVVHAIGNAYMNPTPEQHIPGKRIVELDNYIATVDIVDTVA